MEDELLTIRQVAERIGVQPHTILSWRSRRKGPQGFPLGFRLGSDRAGLRWHKSEVDAWIASRRNDVEARSA